MSLRWRWCLVILMAATVLGGFMPRALLSGSAAPSSAAPSNAVALRAEEPPIAPTGCFDASCSKGAPAPATPSLTMVALAAITSSAFLFMALRPRRRTRSRDLALPRGTFTALFRPPQFS